SSAVQRSPSSALRMAEHSSAITERIFRTDSPGPTAGGAAREPVRSSTISSGSPASASLTAGTTPVSSREENEFAMGSPSRLKDERMTAQQRRNASSSALI